MSDPRTPDPVTPPTPQPRPVGQPVNPVDLFRRAPVGGTTNRRPAGDPTHTTNSGPVLEYCRECRDENLIVAADFILWGKFFPPEALGPRCYDHASDHIGSTRMGQIDQYAVFDLRKVRAALRGGVDR